MRRETQNLGLLKWIIPELRVLALTKRHVGSGNEIAHFRATRLVVNYHNRLKIPASCYLQAWQTEELN